jgi:hypothetical protein
MRRLDSKWRTVAGDEFVPDATGPEAGDSFRLAVDDGEAGRGAFQISPNGLKSARDVAVGESLDPY